ncbi:hypothetical protein ScPMuIL_012555 [Solemya velum]
MKKVYKVIEMSGVETSDEGSPPLSGYKGRRTRTGDRQSSTPESFSWETKFVVLNFLSITSSESPSVRTSGTSSSPASFSDSWPKTTISPSKLLHASQQVSKKANSWPSSYLPSSQDSAEINQSTDVNQSCDMNLDKSSSSIGSEDITAFSEQNSEEPHMFSWKKSLKYRRTVSEFTSDSGDTSYVSDADDELEDTSNASSIMGNNGRSNSNMDFLQAVSRLPTVYSESEMESELMDAEVNQHHFQRDFDDKIYKDTQEDYFDDVDGIIADDTSSQEDAEGAAAPSLRRCKLSDRSNLRLDLIPVQNWSDDDFARRSFQAGLQEEMTSLESEVEDAIRKQNLVFNAPILAPLTPQTEAARMLARIGDEVKDQYGNRLNVALASLVSHFHTESLTYDAFRASASHVIDESMPGWRQVALLLVYSQQVALLACKRGQKSLGHILDYTTILMADLAADFVIKQGGWGAVMNYDPSNSSESADSDANKRQQNQITHNPIQSSEFSSLGSNTDMDGGDTQSWPMSLLTNVIGRTGTSIALSLSLAIVTIAVSVACLRK